MDTVPSRFTSIVLFSRSGSEDPATSIQACKASKVRSEIPEENETVLDC